MIFSFMAMALLGIWFLGAVYITLNNEIQRKHDCIQQKGVFKGLIYCEGDLENPFYKNIENLYWPLKLFSTTYTASSIKDSDPDHTSKAKGIKHETYLADPNEQSVILFKEGAIPIRLKNCKVKDAKNWSCTIWNDDVEFGYRMTNGRLEELP